MSEHPNKTIIFYGQAIVVKGKRIGKFWGKVKIGEPDQCWPWTRGTVGDGYGQFSVGYTKILAHRFAWVITHGDIPEKLLVCHECDNPPCCNPRHLFLGTHIDNNRDRESKGRSRKFYGPRPDMIGDNNIFRRRPELVRGEGNANAKIKEADVLKIRAILPSGKSVSATARSLGVGRNTIRRIKTGESWAHVK